MPSFCFVLNGGGLTNKQYRHLPRTPESKQHMKEINAKRLHKNIIENRIKCLQSKYY